MRCLAEPDLATFADAVNPHLLRDPVGNNLAYTILEARRSGRAPVEPGARWLRVVEGDQLVLVALHTPPFPLLLTDGPPAAVDVLADHLLTGVPELAKASGPELVARRFAQRWSAATGVEPAVAMRQGLFRLDAVTAPSGVPGKLRVAGPPDRDLLLDWYDGFERDVHGEPLGDRASVVVDRVLARGDALWLWEVGGEPVTMVGIAPPVAAVARIAPVYTPPGSRGNGYASAATAAVSQSALERGALACTLYTDLANPISNRVYRRVGYRLVSEHTQWRLR